MCVCVSACVFVCCVDVGVCVCNKCVSVSVSVLVYQASPFSLDDFIFYTHML